MKIIKVPVTEQNKRVYFAKNKNKKAWEKLMSECPSMTSKEFWDTREGSGGSLPSLVN